MARKTLVLRLAEAGHSLDPAGNCVDGTLSPARSDRSGRLRGQFPDAMPGSLISIGGVTEWE